MKRSNIFFSVGVAVMSLLTLPLFCLASSQYAAATGFRWEAAIDLPAETAAKASLDQTELLAPLYSQNMDAAVENEQLVLSGQEGMAQMRAVLFDTQPEVDLLGGVVEMTVHLPAGKEQITLELEARITAGYGWEVLEGDGVKQVGESKFDMRYSGLGAPSIQTIQLEATGEGDAVAHLVYRQWFEPEELPHARLDVWMPTTVNELELSDPTPPEPVAGAEAAFAPQERSDFVESTAEPLSSAATLPARWDWRAKGIVPPVRTQKGCGACWAFGLVGIMESAMAKETGVIRDLSEQFLISCNLDGKTCNSGAYPDVLNKYHYDTLAKNQTKVGAVLEAEKPYIRADDSCDTAYAHHYKQSQKIKPFKEYQISVAEIKRAIMNWGPVLSNVCVTGEFKKYKGGVYAPTKNECNDDTNHTVIIVGWENSTSSWIVRNSWGQYWGEGGYIRIKWDANYSTSRIGEDIFGVKYDLPVVHFTTSAQNANEDVGTVEIQAELTEETIQDVTIPLKLSGTAKAGVDYELPAIFSITIHEGETTGKAILSIKNDKLVESNKTIVITMGEVKGATKGTETVHTVTILDDETTPKVNFTAKSQTVKEDAGPAKITAALSQATPKEVSIPFKVSGTATNGGVDHNLSDGYITIPVGQKTGEVAFIVTNDMKIESDETIVVTMGTPVNATKGTVPVHTVTIKDDDTPTVNFTEKNIAVWENVGTSSINVELSKATSEAVIIPYTVGGTAKGGGVDHDLSKGSITIPVGQTTGSITFNVTDDTKIEPDKTIIVTMGKLTNGVKGTVPVHTVTIKDDDASVNFSSNQTVKENVGAVRIKAILSRAIHDDVEVPFTVGGSATGGVDHNLSNGSIIIPAGDTMGSVTFNVLDDSKIEPAETVVVTMGEVSNAFKGTATVHTVTIKDDDTPTVNFASPAQTVWENHGEISINVTLSKATSETVIVPYTVSGTASGGVDHNLSSSHLSIPVGHTTGKIFFRIKNDAMDEYDETIVVTMGKLTNGIKGATPVHTVTIKDDDPPPTVNFTRREHTVQEYQGTFVFEVTLSNASSKDVTVPFTVGGTAKGGFDHTLSNGYITIPAGRTTGGKTFTIINDAIDEGVESIYIYMGSPTNAISGTRTYEVWMIEDDDPPPVVNFNTCYEEVKECGGPTVNARVDISGRTEKSFYVCYRVGGDATPGYDHNLKSYFCHLIPFGAKTDWIQFKIIDDTKSEGNEDIDIRIDEVVNGNKGSGCIMHTVRIDENCRVR